MDTYGAITDLSVEDPGYTNNVGDPTYTTTFPSVFPSGETPDVELPPGTKYQVEVVATNELGSDTKLSNDVMPVAGLLQSSVITANDTSTGIYSSTSTLNVTSGSSIVNAFDGDLTTSVNAGVTTSYTWLTQASLTINTQMRIYTGNGGVTLDYRINGTEYQNVAVANQAGWTIVPFTGVANGIEIKTQGSSMLVNAVEVDGTILLDSTTVLTTTDNTNYNLFSAGGAVVESSGGTPITSAITSITDKSYNTFPNGYVNNMMGLYLNQSVQRGLVLSKLLDGSDVAVSPASHGIGTSAIGGPGNAWVIGDVLNVALDAAAGKVWYGINGTWLCSGTPSSASGMMIQAPVNSPMYFQSTTQLPQSRGCSFGINRVAEYTIPTGFTLFAGSWLNGGEASATDAPDSTGQWPVAKTYAEFKYLSAADAVSGAGGANLINLGFTNGPATGGDVYTLLQLNLQNDTNLANFRAGDVVQVDNTSWNQSTIWSQTSSMSTTIGDTSQWLLNLFNGQGSIAPNVDYVEIPNVDITGVTSINVKSNGSGSISVFVNTVNIGSIATDSNAVERSISWDGSTINTLKLSTTNTQDMYYISFTTSTGDRMLVDGNVLPKGASEFKVNAINESPPSITIDGGTWTNGDVVTGPTFPAATGTISAVDSTNSKLTFSETTGRWLVTQSDYDTAKKLNTKVEVPLVLNQNNAAHVALFNAINTSLTAYATDKTTFVDALRTKIQGLGLSIPELQVLCNVSHTLIKAYVVTVASYASANKFYLDGTLQLALTFKKGTTYIFDQDDASNTGHPLKLYTDAAKTTEYTTGVSFIGTPGSALARTIFNVPTNAPATLYYQCGNHAAMGAAITITS